MNEFVISGTWGEYDDYTKIPMFVCHSEDEASLFCDSLNKSESPFFEKVIEYFGEAYYVPNDIYFVFDRVPLLEL